MQLLGEDVVTSINKLSQNSNKDGQVEITVSLYMWCKAVVS